MFALRFSNRAVSLALVALLSAFGVSYAGAVADCAEMQCHVNAWCELDGSASVCACQPGYIGNGYACEDNGYSVRYVIAEDPGSTNPSATMTRAAGMAKCMDDAEGYYIRLLMAPYASETASTEVYCIYSTPEGPNATLYEEWLAAATPSVTVVTPPRVYAWTVPTTSNPLQIAPTGMTVDSVDFDTTCADSGCWVIKGTLTTGMAFNEYGSFNTFFLPQANITGLHPEGDISYDYSYSEVEWTFQPANHPCTSVQYSAGAAGNTNDKISSCCISQPDVGSSGGFVANYRPTQAFVDWAGTLTCDVTFDRGDEKKCWKLFRELNTWDDANDRCAVAGGHLALVTSDAEADMMEAWMLETLPDMNFEALSNNAESIANEVLYSAARAWIGLKEIAQGNGTYAWVDDSTFDQTPLDLSFASNWKDSKLGCVSWVRPSRGFQKQSCTHKHAFVCEFEPPSFDETCIQHAIQRPGYSAPPPDRPCWKVQSGGKKTWADAASACEAAGGHLPVIYDKEDNLFFRRMLDNFPEWSAWLGVTKNTTTNIWAYENGIEVPGALPSFYSSTEGTLGVYYSGTGTGDCVRMVPGAFWRQEDCDAQRPVVCQFDRETLADGETCDSDFETTQDLPTWDLVFPTESHTFIDVGKFKGMNASPGVSSLELLDPFFSQYSYEIRLDEVELRSKAGKLKGTVGVEHTIDTYLGFANFRPTGFAALDTFATQVAIHLEKTNFFSVSTHGTNDFTFLEYVNMRLVTVFYEDTDFSGSGDSTGAGAGGTNDDQAADRTVRTDSSNNKCYVQVTFTMGTQYQPNLAADAGGNVAGLIPLDSVRAGKGTFIDDVDVAIPAKAGDMTHVCEDYGSKAGTALVGVNGYTGTGPDNFCTKDEFEDAVDQECGPKSSMCVSPTSVPDAFVSFNVPLGQEVFEDPKDDLSNNIFVDMVINAVDTTPGATPSQMKTTLTASIPIVTGGLNIFCDGFTAKTDLKDVANVDIIVGSAASTDELTRLRILEDIASTQLQADDPDDNVIDSPSIESGLLTLVLKGNHSYFDTGNENTGGYSMELDDAITIHIMEDGVAPGDAVQGDGSKMGTVMELLATPADDNSDTNGLDTNGYALNGAFYFTITRDAAAGASRAELEPSEALKTACPFNPVRPEGVTPLETCITRRDVRSRGYPLRTGADETTAMEIAAFDRLPTTPVLQSAADAGDAADVTTYLDDLVADSTCRECVWLTSILGNNINANELAISFAKTIHETYDLNGRYRRAYWINPGYEWTPTQTGGSSLFSISQKVYLFALISLDENWDRRRSGAALPSKRRMLLQTEAGSGALEEGAASIAGADVTFDVTPASLLANIFDVSERKINRFEVEVALTPEEACMDLEALHQRMQVTMVDYFENSKVSAAIHTVQVTGLTREMNGHECSRRRSLQRKLLAAGFSDATAMVQIMLVFDSSDPWISLQELEQLPGIEKVTPDERNTAIYPDPGDGREREDEDSSSNVPLIAGVAGGVGGALVLAGGAFFMMRKREPTPQTAQPIQTVNVADLKSQLAADL